jgi:myo-inositol 2-dehydrogenase / D-chiro-inositol 1-dehydrogenase
MNEKPRSETELPHGGLVTEFTDVTNTATRRNFMKSSALAGAVVALASPRVYAAGNETIRVGLVGCGGRGSGAAVNALEADGATRIVALADLFEESINSCRKSLGKQYPDRFTVSDDMCFSGFDGYKKLMASDVDVVLLASPPHYRPDHIEAAVEAGKQIFCEKPVATDPAGVRRVEAACKLAEQKGLNVVSGLCWRYDAGLVETMNRVRDGAIGKVVSTQANYLTSPLWIKARKEGESEMHYQCRNWYYYTWLSGDHFVEQFIHSLDKAMWLHDDVPPVSAIGLGGRQRRSDLTQGNSYDHFAVTYTWADGTKTHAYTRQMAGCMMETEDHVYGTKGYAQLINHKITGDQTWQFSEEKVQMHQAEQNEFFKAIRGERDRINNGQYMCKSTMMSILGREACYSGQELTYDQVAASKLQWKPSEYSFDAMPPQSEIAQPGKYKFT